MKQPTFAAVAVALLFTTSLSAKEESGSEVRFSYSAEETETPEGAATLYERIISYSRSECRTIDGSMRSNPKSDKCAAELVDQLLETIDSPLLFDAARAKAQTPRSQEK